MRISISDADLGAAFDQFQSTEGAQLEFTVSPDGIDVVGNSEGYLDLARWCLLMAHPEMEDHADPEFLHAAYHLADYASEQSISVVAREGRMPEALEPHDVRFYRSCLAGEQFWEAGND